MNRSCWQATDTVGAAEPDGDGLPDAAGNLTLPVRLILPGRPLLLHRRSMLNGAFDLREDLDSVGHAFGWRDAVFGGAVGCDGVDGCQPAGLDDGGVEGFEGGGLGGWVGSIGGHRVAMDGGALGQCQRRVQAADMLIVADLECLGGGAGFLAGVGARVA